MLHKQFPYVLHVRAVLHTLESLQISVTKFIINVLKNVVIYVFEPKYLANKDISKDSLCKRLSCLLTKVSNLSGSWHMVWVFQL